MANAVKALLLTLAVGLVVVLLERQPGVLLIVAVLMLLAGASRAGSSGGYRPVVPPPEVESTRRAGRRVLRGLGERLGGTGEAAGGRAANVVRAVCEVIRRPNRPAAGPRRGLGGLLRRRQIGPGPDGVRPGGTADPGPGEPEEPVPPALDGPDDPPRPLDPRRPGESGPAEPGPVSSGPEGLPPGAGGSGVGGSAGVPPLPPPGPLSGGGSELGWSGPTSGAGGLAGPAVFTGPAWPVLPAGGEVAGIATTTTTATAVLAAAPEGFEMAQNLVDAARGQVDLGHRGHVMIAALIREWATSKDARRYPETFIAWLHTQYAAAGQRPDVVWQCMQAYHGRGPSGHMGVPEAMLRRFFAAYQQAAEAEAAAYRQFAQEYAAYVDQAEHDLPRKYGREVIASAARAHRG